ncbi:MAG: hypothetical protein HYX35_01525 [Proteobacteria bacterium]|nr:hypothetical protein [Pseudomonadota bacterium]
MTILSISKTIAFIATLMMATSAFSMDTEDLSVQSALGMRLTPPEVKEIARLPLSDPKSYRHWARPDLITALEGGEKKFQTFLSYEDPQYKTQSGFRDFNIRPIQNNTDDHRHFGRSFHSFTGIELPCLLDCYSPLGTPPKKYIELACADGKMVWKATAAGALTTANDLSSKELGLLDMIVQYRVPTQVTSITKIPGSCFDILTQNPTLRGTSDVLFSKNLVHFLNDQEAIKFAHLVRDLLKENGTAYITANTFLKQDVAPKALFVKNQNENNPFPGFQVHTRLDTLVNGGSVFSTALKTRNANPGEKMDRVMTPKKSLTEKEITTFLQEHPQILPNVIMAQQRDRRVMFERVLYNQPGMLFDIKSLGSLFQREAGLTILDGFYLDEDGKRLETYDDTAVFVSVILKKPTQQSTTQTTTSQKTEE